MRCWSIRWCHKKVAVSYLTAGERNYECILTSEFYDNVKLQRVHKMQVCKSCRGRSFLVGAVTTHASFVPQRLHLMFSV